MDDLKNLRSKIDDVDEKILQLLAERVQICGAVGSTKKSQKLPIRDTQREKEVYNRIREKATRLSLNPVQIEAVYREIVNMCSSVQE